MEDYHYQSSEFFSYSNTKTRENEDPKKIFTFSYF